MNKKRFIIICLVILIVVALFSLVLAYVNKGRSNDIASEQTKQPNIIEQPLQQSTEQSTITNSTSDTNSDAQGQPTEPKQIPAKSTWPVNISQQVASSSTVVVNKKHKLPDTYIPSPLVSIGGVQLRQDAKSAMDDLLAAASVAGYSLKILSGYRSYSYQANLYDSYVARDGKIAADTYSARPGFSEHQLGLAGDVGNSNGSCDLETCFGDSAAGLWIASNAQNYGFIVRYPMGKELETGYQYEPWHLRYLGIDIAKSVYSSGETLDQYYNIPAGGYE